MDGQVAGGMVANSVGDNGSVRLTCAECGRALAQGERCAEHPTAAINASMSAGLTGSAEVK